MSLIADTYWAGMPFRFQRPPADAAAEPRILRTADFRDVPALFWTPRGTRPSVAVVAMHPRVDFTQHYTFPRLLAAGVACLGARSRYEGDDTGCVHEELLLDLAACVGWLREHRGVRHVVLLGNSGGGSLAAYYQAQAARPASERIRQTPGGAATRFERATMPPADGLVVLAAHRGQGQVLLRAIDPSVTDELDPLSVDPELDMYDPANGFAPPPEWTTYAPPFVERYRAAQRARVERIDAVARAWLDNARIEGDDLASVRRRHVEPVLTVYRTMANLDYVDNHLDPSPRPYGSLVSHRPDLVNFKRVGFARTVSPEAWLSTWSGLSSRADLVRNLPEVRVPTLVVHAARDRDIFPRADHAPIDAAVTAEDRTIRTLDAGHYFEPEVPGARERPHTEALLDLVVPWILDRFGAH